jgi:5-methyltetrahydrofolate--homocysteine methyltransferase
LPNACTSGSAASSGATPGRAVDQRRADRRKVRGHPAGTGLPGLPDHTEKRILFDLLDAEARADIKLTESFAMYPASSVSGWYFSHPESRYFGLGKIARDQVEDYARRKGMTVAEVERWLAPNLNYDA